MRFSTFAILGCMAGAISGCGAYGPVGRWAGSGIDFISSNPDSVLLDFNSHAPGELQQASRVAAEQCGMFGRGLAMLESLNTRGNGMIRATYVCKN